MQTTEMQKAFIRRYPCEVPRTVTGMLPGITLLPIASSSTYCIFCRCSE